MDEIKPPHSYSSPLAAAAVDNDSSGVKSSPPTRSGSEIVFQNFRELLWYWGEYYLRRGRDRLSIEFSCHIPFRYWHSIVGLMCRDNGDATSLLSCPMRLPVSPYSRSTPSHPAALPSEGNSVYNA
mmetsp:Transcript_15522/g.31370  ORF Transcript_15522/g.31370 Transcript_15522/m.31370 type:complete len:126 (-) Transcript_15522:8-385(-)